MWAPRPVKAAVLPRLIHPNLAGLSMRCLSHVQYFLGDCLCVRAGTHIVGCQVSLPLTVELCFAAGLAGHASVILLTPFVFLQCWSCRSVWPCLYVIFYMGA